MSETNTVSPLRQHMIEDMAARKLNPHTQRSAATSISRSKAACSGRYATLGKGEIMNKSAQQFYP
jgi:hypothetical protein